MMVEFIEEQKNLKTFKRATPWIRTTINISPEFYDLAKLHGLCISECARVGMSLAFAELDIIPYDNNINLFRRMKMYQKSLEEAQQRIAELERRNITAEDLNVNKEINI